MVKTVLARIKTVTVFEGILFLLVILSVSFFAFLFFRKSTTLTIRVKVHDESVLWNGPGSKIWFAQLFYPGMKEKDGLGQTIAEVTDVRTFDLQANRQVVYMTIKLNTVYNRGSNQFTFRGKPVLVGSTIKLYLDTLLVDGLITYIEGTQDLREPVVLELETQIRDETAIYPETSGTKSYVADALEQGQVVMDSNGNEIIRIVKKSTENAKRAVITDTGNIVLREHVLRKDVYLTLRVHGFKLNNRYYIYDDIPLLVGLSIPINSPIISVWPEITSIKEVSQQQ